MQKLVILAVCARLMQRSVHGWRSPCPLEHEAAWVGLEEAGHTPTPSPEWLSIPCDWVFPSPRAVAQVIREKATMELSGSLPAIAKSRAPLGEVVFSQHWLVPPGTPCPDLITAVLRGRHKYRPWCQDLHAWGCQHGPPHFATGAWQKTKVLRDAIEIQQQKEIISVSWLLLRQGTCG